VNGSPERAALAAAGPRAVSSSRAARVLLESLRLDFDSEEVVRARAGAALALGVGGFIVFGGRRDQVARLVEDLRGEADHPLWIASDLERGAGQQFAGLPTLPPPAGLAAHPAPEDAARLAGAITARSARAVGVDMVFAPVLDLDVMADNPIIGTRAFGSDPVTVARLGGAWIEGCQAEGVVACGKHFPGHGRTSTDSHAEIPVVGAARAELEADLLPFRRVAPHVGAILTAHVAYPSLGAPLPATITPSLLTGLLREEMGFEGLIVTDAMNMSGFLDAEVADGGDGADEGAVGNGAAGSAASRDPVVLALTAGCDLLLYPADLAAAVASLERAAETDPAVAARLAEALDRSVAVRARLVGKRGSATASGTAATPDEDARAAALLSMLSITVRGERPDWLHRDRPIRVEAVWDDREAPARPPFGEGFVDELRSAGWSVVDATEAAGAADAGGAAGAGDAPDATEAADAADAKARAEAPSIVLVASTPQAWKGTAGLTPPAAAAIEGALANPRGAYPVVFGHARLLGELGGAGLCAWGTEPIMERFAARKIAQTDETA
jgi:beta-glucosidase